MQVRTQSRQPPQEPVTALDYRGVWPTPGEEADQELQGPERVSWDSLPRTWSSRLGFSCYVVGQGGWVGSCSSEPFAKTAEQDGQTEFLAMQRLDQVEAFFLSRRKVIS